MTYILPALALFASLGLGAILECCDEDRPPIERPVCDDSQILVQRDGLWYCVDRQDDPSRP